MLQGLVEAQVKKATMALLDSVETIEVKDQVLRGLGRLTGNILLEQLEQAAAGSAPWAPGPPGSKWAVGIAVVLGVVLIMAGLMVYYFRCGCTGPGDNDKARPCSV